MPKEFGIDGWPTAAAFEEVKSVDSLSDLRPTFGSPEAQQGFLLQAFRPVEGLQQPCISVFNQSNTGEHSFLQTLSEDH